MDANRRRTLKRGAIAGALALAFLSILGMGHLVKDGVSTPVGPVASAAPAAAAPAPVAVPPGEAAPVAAPQGTADPGAGAAGGKTFRADAAGRLVLNEATRLGVEALVALTPPDQLRTAVQAQVDGLPAAAAAEALDLVERYDGYQAAQKLSFPPGTAPLVPEEALAELDGLHALRVSYFGQDMAQSLFGEEEAVARKLLEFMRADTAPGLSMDQRAVRAQARFDAWHATSGSGTR